VGFCTLISNNCTNCQKNHNFSIVWLFGEKCFLGFSLKVITAEESTDSSVVLIVMALIHTTCAVCQHMHTLSSHLHRHCIIVVTTPCNAALKRPVYVVDDAVHIEATSVQ